MGIPIDLQNVGAKHVQFGHTSSRPSLPLNQKHGSRHAGHFTGGVRVRFVNIVQQFSHP
ncbi:unnamed protein product [Gemmata massiliana]|uniref:Uncharacterized protein n=1 Tax=Gemmata massiliana TaxID=1210884 RepID=A0A6P2DC94_9BACT|nr:unnamed protein product [Gemmata massiliana]